MTCCSRPCPTIGRGSVIIPYVWGIGLRGFLLETMAHLNETWQHQKQDTCKISTTLLELVRVCSTKRFLCSHASDRYVNFTSPNVQKTAINHHQNVYWHHSLTIWDDGFEDYYCIFLAVSSVFVVQKYEDIFYRHVLTPADSPWKMCRMSHANLVFVGNNIFSRGGVVGCCR